MTLAPIHDGDLLVVNRARKPQTGDIVLASIDGDFTVKRLRILRKRSWLQPDNPDFPDIELSEERDCIFWGVVTSAITQFNRG